MSFEKLLLSNLTLNDGFARKVIPFIKEEYFKEQADKAIFKVIYDYVQKYTSFPSKEAIAIELSTKDNLQQQTFDECMATVSAFDVDTSTDEKWLLDSSEKFCQERAIQIALRKSVDILDEKDTKLGKGMIPALLQQALAVTFDTRVGHDFMENFEERYDYYHLKESKLEFDIELFNKITKGGISRKTLSVILAGTGVGKTMVMCHMAAHNLMTGKNVLYITNEMAEERIAERIDANILDVTIDELHELSKDSFATKIGRAKGKTTGKLIIKEYPTSTANVNNFRHLLEELRVKKKFVPDIIYIDYLNICASSRVKYGANVNSYTYIKNIAEEIRGLAVEYDVPIVSATQTNREGFTSSDPGMENTSESFGLPATVDLMFALISTEELEARHQIMVKQLKNRYGPLDVYRRFVVGIDRSRMKMYDCEPDAQDGLMDDTPPIMENTKFGTEDRERKKSGKFDKGKFRGFA